MKKRFLLFLSLSFYISSHAVTIDVQTAGTLQNLVYDFTSTDLTVTGSINASDIRFLRDNLNNLTSIDISQVSIQAYIGNNGTDLNTSNYNSDQLPPFAFDGKKSLKTIILPSNLTSISFYAFRSCSGLINIIFPSTVSNIDYYAFQSCTSLASVTFGNNIPYYGIDVFTDCDKLIEFIVQPNNTDYSVLDGVLFNKDQTKLIRFPVGKAGNYTIPNTVTSISNSAFGGCKKLTGVTIPNTISTIEFYTFQSCIGLTNVSIPNSVVKISNLSFSYCTNLTTVILGSSVSTIENYAFGGCNKLTSINIPNSVTSIANNAFGSCSSLIEFTVQSGNQYFSTLNGVLYDKNQTTLVQYPIGKQGEYIMPNTITSIPNQAFSGCAGLSKITIGNSVKTIGVTSFNECIGLTSLIIPNSIESIGLAAFQGCINIKSILIGNSVNSIGDNALSSCASLSDIVVLPENANYCAIDNVLYDKNQTKIICFPISKQGKYTIPITVTSIPEMAFSLCKGLTSITIGNSITSIGGYAFQQCSRLQVIYCTNQTPPTVSTSSFYGANPYAVYVPISAISAYKGAAGWSAFNIIGEKRVTINNPNAGSLAGNLISSGYGPLSSITHLTVTGNLNSVDILQMKTNMTTLTEIDISGASLLNNVLPSSAFQDKYILTSISLPASLLSIGDYAFSGCSRLLGSLPISASITSIGNNAFSGCSSITGNLIIPTTLNVINSYSFSGCSGLSGTLSIQNSISTIGAYAFQGCSNLTGSLTIPNTVTSIGASAFSNCSRLTGTLTLPNSITSIPTSTFSNCNGLTGILTIPLSVTTIGSSAFSSCSKLSELYFSKNTTTTIADNAFMNCTGLTKISSPRSIPPTIYANTFGGIDKETCTLEVPTGSSLSYQIANYWSLFILFSETTVADSYGVTTLIGSGGNVSENNVTLGNGSLLMADINTTKTFTVTPNPGYEVATLTYAGANVKSQLANNQYTTPAINTNTTLSVTFQRIVYKISIQTGGSGAMNLNYYYGDTPSFDFTPSLGSKIKSVMYNDVDVTANLVGNVYTLPTITSNGTLVVNFTSISTDNSSPEDRALKVYSAGTDIIVQGTTEGETVKLYNMNGQLLQIIKSAETGVIFGVQRGAVYLVRTKTKTFKVIL